MTLVLENDMIKADRHRVEAIGFKDANRIIAESLTPNYIQW